MNASTRRIVSFTFIAAFLIAAPLLLLYTLGYRYNAKRNSIQSTGALSLVSIPKDASVSLNGVQQPDRTPLRITQLIPGTYALEVEKEGWSSWRKLVTIAPGAHTIFAPIRLFPVTEPESATDAPYFDRLFWHYPSSLWVARTTPAHPSRMAVSHLFFPARASLPFNGTITAGAAESHDLALALVLDAPPRLMVFFLSLTDPPQPKTTILPMLIRGMRWIGNSALLAWDDTTLFTLSLDGKVRASLPLPSVRDAYAENQRIVVLSGASDGPLTLSTTNLTLTSIVSHSEELPASSEITLIPNSTPGIMSTLDTQSSTFTLYDPGNPPQSFSHPGVKFAEWSKDQSILLMISNHEIQLVTWPQRASPERTLLNRVSESITSYLFAEELDGVFFTTPTRLSFIHLNPSIDQELHTLSTWPQLEIIGADPSFNRLYIKNKEQLLSYPLQSP